MKRLASLCLMVGSIAVPVQAQFQPATSCEDYRNQIGYKECKEMVAAAQREKAAEELRRIDEARRVDEAKERDRRIKEAEAVAERGRLAAEKLENERAAQLERLPQTHIDRIHQYRSEIARVQGIIDRERRIGRTSGYVNKQTLYQAGEFIEMCREKIAAEYREYRATGGRRPLSAL